MRVASENPPALDVALKVIFWISHFQSFGDEPHCFEEISLEGGALIRRAFGLSKSGTAIVNTYSVTTLGVSGGLSVTVERASVEKLQAMQNPSWHSS